MQEELVESEEKYRCVVERANDGIVIAQGRKVVLANQAFASMSGYSADEIIGMEFLEFVPKELHSKIADPRFVDPENGDFTLQPDAPELIKELLRDGLDVSVETNGSLPVKDMIALDRGERLRISMDVKCPSSKMEGRMRLENLDDLRERDQVKFVLRDMRDYAHALDVLATHRTRAAIIFQPVWGRRTDRIAEAVLADGLDVRVLVQLHKVIWGARTKGR
jgi:7-carboxy-7-deazaguanine synthase